MTRDQLIEVLQYGTYAPSGDNCQPWLVKIDNDTVSIILDTTKDQSLYNYKQIASLLSLGAFVENISIASMQVGFNVEINFQEGNELVAKIKFIDSQPIKHELFEYIKKRCTNRKPYKDYTLSQEDISYLETPYHFAKLKIETNSSKINHLAHAASQNEALVLNNTNLHNFLFSHIVWSETEMNAQKQGMYVRTLEMNSFQEKIFSLCSNWRILKFLNKLSLYKKIAKENEIIYAKSSAFGLLVSDSLSSENLFNVGRQMQSLWLKVISVGLSLHPLTGIIFLKNRIKNGGGEVFTPKETALINSSYDTITKVFDLKENDNAIFMFRLGKSDEPSAYSLKKDLNDLLIK